MSLSSFAHDSRGEDTAFGFFFFLIIRPPPRSPFFPYTPLFRSFRTHVSSNRGAYGLMQLQPSTFAWTAGREPDIGDGAAVSEDPVIDVRLAVRYFRWLEKKFPRQIGRAHV